VKDAAAAGIGIWDIASQDADLAGSSPIHRLLAVQGDCAPNFQLSFPASYREGFTPMALSMYKASAPIFVQFLTNLSGVPAAACCATSPLPREGLR
jgi:hypothetical protein